MNPASALAPVTLDLQRTVAERLLLSALDQMESAEKADDMRRRALFLAVEGRRLSQSLDEDATLGAMGRME